MTEVKICHAPGRYHLSAEAVAALGSGDAAKGREILNRMTGPELTRAENDELNAAINAMRHSRLVAHHNGQQINPYGYPMLSAQLQAQKNALAKSQHEYCGAVMEERKRAVNAAMRSAYPMKFEADDGTLPNPYRAERARLMAITETREKEILALQAEVAQLCEDNRTLAKAAEGLLGDVHANGTVRKLTAIIEERNGEITRLKAASVPKRVVFPVQAKKTAAMGHAIDATIAGWTPVVAVLLAIGLAWPAAAQALISAPTYPGSSMSVITTNGTIVPFSTIVCDRNDTTPAEVIDCKLAYWKERLADAQKRKADAEKDIDKANERLSAFSEAKRAR